MNHQAIFKAYPNVVTIDDEAGAFDANGNIVEIDVKKVKAAEVILFDEYKKNEEAVAAARSALLERLGITEDEAKLLLG
jgi:uncharacterized protein YrzB (UPF0473 family)